VTFSVRFWNVLDNDNEKTVSHIDSITCYTVSFDGDCLVTGSSDCSLKVWEVQTGKLTQVLVAHQLSITCMALAPFADNKLLSGSVDCALIVWDLTTGQCFLRLLSPISNASLSDSISLSLFIFYTERMNYLFSN
jgi:WD40 repeat protein